MGLFILLCRQCKGWQEYVYWLCRLSLSTKVKVGGGHVFLASAFLKKQKNIFLVGWATHVPRETYKQHFGCSNIYFDKTIRWWERHLSYLFSTTFVKIIDKEPLSTIPNMFTILPQFCARFESAQFRNRFMRHNMNSTVQWSLVNCIDLFKFCGWFAEWVQLLVQLVSRDHW